MRGPDQQQSHIFSYISPEQRVRKDHSLRAIRAMVDEVPKELSPEFTKMYAKVGRPSIPPEQLLRALLLQMLYSVRSERLLVEEIDYNILYRWFVGLNLDDEVWDATTFTKNRNRLLEAEVAKDFLAQVVKQAQEKGWTSDEHFTVDGTLLEAWASMKSFQPRDKKSSPPPDDPGNPTMNFHGEKRSNQTHESKSDPEAQLARKGQGKEAKLSYSGNLLVENRNGLIVDSRVWEATGTAERYAALDMLQNLPGDQRSRWAATRASIRRSLWVNAATFTVAERGQRHRWAHQPASRLSHQPEEKEAHRRVFWLAEDHCVVAQSAASRNVEGGLDIHVRLRGL
jgi:transposase